MFRLLLGFVSTLGPTALKLAQQVTISFDVAQVVTWVIVGLIAGFLAGLLVRGRRFGMITSIIVGLIGALIGGAIFTVLHISVPAVLNEGVSIRYIDIIVALIGAIIILLILRLFYRYR